MRQLESEIYFKPTRSSKDVERGEETVGLVDAIRGLGRIDQAANKIARMLISGRMGRKLGLVYFFGLHVFLIIVILRSGTTVSPKI